MLVSLGTAETSSRLCRGLSWLWRYRGPLCLAAGQITPSGALRLLPRLKLRNEGPSSPIDPPWLPALLGLLRPAEPDPGPRTQGKGNLMQPELAAAYVGVCESGQR